MRNEPNLGAEEPDADLPVPELPIEVPLEASEGDAIEQSLEVPVDEEEDYR